jgi:predicted histone-like DNA-binding protein
MAVLIKLMQNKCSGSAANGKWFAKTVSTGNAHTEDIARKIEENTTFTHGEVKGMMDALVDVMTDMLQDGKTVAIDGFGRFRLVAESRSADKPEDFSIATNVKGVKCRFQPSGKRNGTGRTLHHAFSEKAEVKFAPKYDIDK